MVLWEDHLSPHAKWHLDRFSRFSTVRGYVQQTERHTDHGTSLTIGRTIALCARDATLENYNYTFTHNYIFTHSPD